MQENGVFTFHQLFNMAAPSYLYTYQMPIKNSLGEEKVILLTSSSESSATLLARFYLDFFTIVTREDGVKVWAGACYVGSNNYYMHNTARHGWTRLKEESTGREYVVFWDAGLNTLGMVDNIPDITQYSISSFIINSFKSYSAYYVDGDNYGVQINPDNLGWINIPIGINQLQNTVLDTPIVDVKDYVEFGQSTQVRTYHLNAEGTFVGSYIQTVVVRAGTLISKYSNTYASSALSGSNITRYYTVNDLIGGAIYLDPDATSLSATGYYVTPERWYYFDGTTVIKTGLSQNGYWDSGDPNNSYVRNFNGRLTNLSTVCTAPLNNPQTVYVSWRDGKYYTNALLSTFVQDGYYVNDLLGARDWYHVVNGEMIQQGFCDG